MVQSATNVGRCWTSDVAVSEDPVVINLVLVGMTDALCDPQDLTESDRMKMSRAALTLS